MEPFPLTHWSVVSRAGKSDEDGARRRALESLAALYWKPIYAYLRLRWQCPPDDATDLTQDFFVRIFEGRYLPAADRERGRFRAFLKTCLDNFVRNEYRKEKALSRGGGRREFSIDVGDDPDRFLLKHDGDSPDDILDRHWRRAVLDEALRALSAAYAKEGRAVFFEAFRRYDLAADEKDRPTYDALAQELGISKNELEYYLRLIRKQIVEKVRELLAGSVRGPGELDEEERDFFRAPP